ncbi:hypothetical protein GLYMA_06G212200v4 [Glycine max]|uniref:Uncharacterized protein n=1 Tax=Glycine max TaxID=3847 RepID=A0A0R0JW99_SOYBN|nr:DNA-directed RNA polymerase II subunit RPB1 [Glycine max]KRH54831.1 hypothetical protein GLYMA_06G212200v4 [Glycine max]|eukprot:XP_006582062.2 DNA-directed RNA polymerase II subunit RPB1 [Glycine max]
MTTNTIATGNTNMTEEASTKHGGFGSRERKKSKYLRDPYTNIGDLRKHRTNSKVKQESPTQPIGSIKMSGVIATQPTGSTTMPSLTPTQPIGSTTMPSVTPTQPIGSISIPSVTPTQPIGSISIPSVIPTQPVVSMEAPSETPPSLESSGHTLSPRMRAKLDAGIKNLLERVNARINV